MYQFFPTVGVYKAKNAEHSFYYNAEKVVAHRSCFIIDRCFAISRFCANHHCTCIPLTFFSILSENKISLNGAHGALNYITNDNSPVFSINFLIISKDCKLNYRKRNSNYLLS